MIIWKNFPPNLLLYALIIMITGLILEFWIYTIVYISLIILEALSVLRQNKMTMTMTIHLKAACGLPKTSLRIRPNLLLGRRERSELRFVEVPGQNWLQKRNPCGSKCWKTLENLSISRIFFKFCWHCKLQKMQSPLAAHVVIFTKNYHIIW